MYNKLRIQRINGTKKQYVKAIKKKKKKSFNKEFFLKGGKGSICKPILLFFVSLLGRGGRGSKQIRTFFLLILFFLDGFP